MRPRIIPLVLAATVSAFLIPHSAFPQAPPLLNYQGRLLNGTNLVNGTVGLSLRLFDASTGGSLLYEDSNTVAVTDGLYSTFIGDHPTNDAFLVALTNPAVWVEVAVNGVALAPRERLASVGYSLATRGLLVKTNGSIVLNPDLGANSIAASSAQATIAGGQLNDIGTNAGWSAIGGGADNNVALSSQFATIAGGYLNDIGTNSDLSAIGGGYDNNVANDSHYATIGGGGANLIGERAISVTIGGGLFNIVAVSSSNATIAGGSQNGIGTNSSFSAIGGGRLNVVSANSSHATIAGGSLNGIGANSSFSAISGGKENTVVSGSEAVTISGGYLNGIGTNAHYSVIGGGANNLVDANAFHSTIGGGVFNFISANSPFSTIAGGEGNFVAPNSAYATIAGGQQNTVGLNATNAFAAGRQAKANHRGAFVWADDTSADFASTAPNQFLIRASGGLGVGVNDPAYTADFGGRIRLRGDDSFSSAGIWLYSTVTAAERAFVGLANNGYVGLYGTDGAGWGLVMNVANGYVGIGTTTPTNPLQMASGAYVSAGGTWTSVSDKNRKENFETVDPREILDKVASLPITKWNYTAEPGVRHIGPTAQDFHAAFGVGPGETAIAQIDPDGVALAAIQALAKENAEFRRQNEEMKKELDSIKARLGM